jgi:AcrR family transcriptional regulator
MSTRRDTRMTIRTAAGALVLTHSPAELTVKQVAQAAGVFPNQVTHHFGSKDRLYVDAAFSRFLRDTSRLPRAARSARTPESFATAIARTALAMPSLTAVVSSLTLARNNEELKGVVSGYLRLLLSRSERFLEERITTRGWHADHGVQRAAKTFWTSIFGTALVHQAGWVGTYEDVDIAAGLSLREG